MKSEFDINHGAVVDDGLPGDKKETFIIGTDGAVVDHGLHRALKQRHLQMIALGGVVGCVFHSWVVIPASVE